MINLSIDLGEIGEHEAEVHGEVHGKYSATIKKVEIDLCGHKIDILQKLTESSLDSIACELIEASGNLRDYTADDLVS